MKSYCIRVKTTKTSTNTAGPIMAASAAFLRDTVGPPSNYTRPCSLASSVISLPYSTTVSQSLRQPLRAGVTRRKFYARTNYPRGHGGGTEDEEVEDAGLLTRFSANSEYSSDTL